MDSSVHGKSLLILGGTRISLEIIRLAREMGCGVIGVTSYDPYETSPAKQAADKAHDISATDVDAVVELIKAEHYDGVIAGYSDAILTSYAEICQKAGVPGYASKELLYTFTQKNLYKPILRQFGIPTVDEYTVDMSDFEESVKKIRFPVLVKPADSAGARGITICNGKEELYTAIEKAKSFSHTGRFLVERYIEGREITVNWLFVSGRYYLSCIGNRHVKHNQEAVIPLPVGYTYPAAITPVFIDVYAEKCRQMFRECGIENGLMFMQCKVEDGIPVVYDIGYRMTGAMEYTNLEGACGYNPNKMLIRYALTGSMIGCETEQNFDPYLNGRYGFNVSVLSAPGTIKEIKGVEAVRQFPEVLQAVVARVPGTTVTDSMKGLLAQITVRIIGNVDREEDLYPVMKKIEDTVQIISTEGEVLNLSGIETTDIDGYIYRC